MLSLLYSVLDSADHSPYMLYLLSLCTWASSLYGSLPEYFIEDSVLALITAFHIFIAMTILSVSDAFYKETMLKLHYKLVKTVYDIPPLIPLVTVGLVLLTANLCYKARIIGESDATLRAVISAYTLVCSIILQKFSIGLAKLGPKNVLEMEQKIEKHDIANWVPPPKFIRHLFDPINLILRPDVTGAENIPTDHPALYVTNHSLHGIEMAPFISKVYELKNVFLRGISDRMHFGQLHGEFIRYFGGVNGSRENVDLLMETRQNVLVYPGGAHEIWKQSTVPKYTLMWKERLGFARLAIKHGYPLVPCCAVGTEDMMDIMFDVPVDFAKKDLTLSVIAPIMPHRLQRVYFWFGKPIETTQYQGDWQNDDFAREVRDKVKAAVESGIREMQEKQAHDPNRFMYRHMANSAKTHVKSIVEFCKNPFASSFTSCSDDTEVPANKKADYSRFS